MKKWIKKSLAVLLVLVAALFFLSLNAGPKAGKVEYGVTFSPQQAKDLGLDWKQVYESMLSDLQVKNIRLSAYWNQVEPRKDEYDFSDLDFMLSQASERRVKVVLAVGQRLPRWPECFRPGWASDLKSTDDFNNALQSYLETVVMRYYDNSAISVWQVENEPFLSSFGECPRLDVKEFDREIALVKKIDPSRPVLISDSGELSWWLRAGTRGDIFGTTMYRYVFSDVFKRYWVNYIPFWFYRVKAGLLRLLRPHKQVVIIELQAEPWTTKGIVNTSIDEQFKTMSLDNFNKLLSIGRAAGFSTQYLWGVEWWYWMKNKGHPEFWEEARKLMQN